MEPKQISYEEKLPSLSTKHPWFIAQNLESNKQILYTIGKQHYHYQCRIRELYGRRIRACFHGWMILSNQDSVLWSLWNPITSKLIRLPPLIRKEKNSYECCLTSPPDEPGSVFLLFSNTIPAIVFSRLDRKRKRLKWIEMSYAKQIRSISGVDGCLLRSPTYCNGKVYAMTLSFYYRFVIQVDIMVNGKEVMISILPFVKHPYTDLNRCPAYNSFHHIHPLLKGSCTELFYIGVCFKDETRIDHVYLFKLDVTSMKWEELVDLKDGTFFVEITSDYSACYYTSVVGSELGGYVHIIGDSGKIIYSFHAKDRTMSISPMHSLVQESQASAWAMLEWRFDDVDSKQEEEDKETKIVVRPVNVDNTIGESHLLNMPSHILELIMEHCIGVEYMKFRATCKHCYLAAPMIQWSSKTMLRRLRTYSLVTPWLMVWDHYPGIITFIDPIYGDRYFIKTPQELNNGYQIYCSKYGWLLMFTIGAPFNTEGPRLVFFNPFTGNIIELPPVSFLLSFCFSAPPTSPECVVVGLTDRGPYHVYIHFVSQEFAWRAYHLNFGGDDPYSYHFPTFNGRDVYALCNGDQGLDVFRDIIQDDYSWEVVDNTPVSCLASSEQHFLSNCDQHLLLVIVGELGESVQVFKLSESTQEWEKIDGLGKHMIYISDTSCICLEAESPEFGNKIYFPRLLRNSDTEMVFYSLETCMFHTLRDKKIQESFGANLFETKHHCYPHTWIEPSWS